MSAPFPIVKIDLDSDDNPITSAVRAQLEDSLSPINRSILDSISRGRPKPRSSAFSIALARAAIDETHRIITDIVLDELIKAEQLEPSDPEELAIDEALMRIRTLAIDASKLRVNMPIRSGAEFVSVLVKYVGDVARITNQLTWRELDDETKAGTLLALREAMVLTAEQLVCGIVSATIALEELPQESDDES